MITPRGDQMLTEGQRSAILDEELLHLVSNGGRVQARTPVSAVVETGNRVNHVLHLLISVFMCGLWLPVWLMISAFGGTWTSTVTVDEHGEVHDSRDSPNSRLPIYLFLGLIVLVVIAFALRWG
jgi:hypothetical protein